MKKILFISCQYHLFNDIDCGAAMRSTLFVEALSKVGDVDIISFSNQEIYNEFPNCKVVHQEWRPLDRKPEKNIIGRFRNLVHQLVWPGDPFLYYSLEEHKERVVKEVMAKKEYDYVACRYIAEAAKCGLLKYSDRLILDVDDNLVAAAKRDLSNNKFRFNIQRIIANKRTLFLGIMSRNVLRKVKHSFYSNVNEPPYEKSVFLPNVSNIGNISPLSSPLPHKMLVVGWLDFHPNKNGVKHFVYNVFPKVRNRISDVELNIVGKCKDREFVENLNEIPGINVLGFVDDIRAEYEKTSVIIVPIYQGSGTSVKFAEALMTNRPIVATPMGVRGFEHLCRDGKDFLLAKDDQSFADSIVRLFRSEAFAESISKSALDVGITHFSKDSFMKIVKDTIE